MTDVSQFDRIRGALAAPRPRPLDLDGFERIRLAADPELQAAKAEWEAEQSELKLDRHLKRKYPGSGGGLQCAGCKRLKPLGQHHCANCGYLDGAGYIGVPAPTNYLERWR